jgi:FkbM family methyltransferase
MNLTLWAKMYLDRRKHRGASEFYFRWRPASNGWQRLSVAARDTSFRTDVYVREGTSDVWAFEQVFCNNDYNLRRLARSDDIVRLYQDLNRQGTPLILDLGANVGMASIYFAKNWPTARILSVEPNRQNYEGLCRNVSNLDQVTPVEAAVAAIDGFVIITNPDEDAWAFRTEVAETQSRETIPAVSVDSLMRSVGGGQVGLPFICKIDIEGFESNLFSDNLDWVHRFPIVIIELHDWMLPKQQTSAPFLREISTHNRDFVFFGENVFSISNEF